MAGVLELPLLDPLLDELEATSGSGRGSLAPDVVAELEGLADLLLTGMLGTAPEAIQRRMRVIELLRRADGGRLPPEVADEGDPFGVELRTMLATDAELRRELGALYPLISRASSVTPSTRWRRDATALLDAAGDREASHAAVWRVLATLLRADVASRPDILVGGVRLANQRFARGLLWFAAMAEGSVGMLEAVGLRMGTSGRSDAVVRDVALANTAAALLGESSDVEAAAALGSMRLEITNRNVRKQVDRALAALAARAGTTVDELVDAALPTFGLDQAGRLRLAAEGSAADLELRPDGRVEVIWEAAEAAPPSLTADVEATVERIATGVERERRRLELRLASERAWSMEAWIRRFGDHPVASPLARTLIWTIAAQPGPVPALPVQDGWVAMDEAPLHVSGSAQVRLWHPADASVRDIAAWRATLGARAVQQAIRQADREVFVPVASGLSPGADTRYAGRIVDHRRLRAVIRERGRAVPALGAWDQGDEATAWRDFDSRLRAELRYQAPERTPTGQPVAKARIVAVRFVGTDGDQPPGSDLLVPVRVIEVPPRVFSEALRDVNLALQD
jgi:hypothetical protein